ncbi:MAG: J domain-containing protein [Microscillaceae bacterium]|nr:J domain-containing protein [Microscillaceae bacterium]
MFKDYYSLLEIPFEASLEQIKEAYRKQAKRWHPDKNPGQDTTLQMQDIIEAYSILTDAEVRRLYDRAYSHFRERYGQDNRHPPHNSKPQNPPPPFVYEDELLKQWIAALRQQAEAFWQQSLADLKGMSQTGGQAMRQEFLRQGLGLLLMLVVVALWAALAPACQP